ncbi:hypothetical protein ACFLVJ_02490 [Chloroflexota bacterium]
MTFLKNLAVGLFSFLLFFSLSVFGLAFTLKSTVLDANFVTSELDRLEISPLLEDFLRIESPPETPDLYGMIYQTTSDIEPDVKKQLSSAVRSVYDYLLGETSQPELKSILKDTFLNADFVASLVDNVDIAPLLGPFIAQQFTEAIPIEVENLDEYITEALTAAEPSLKEQIVTISDPLFDYLLMESPTFEATISVEEIKESLKDKLLQALMESPPPELAVIPPALRESFVNQYFQEFADQIPSDFVLDDSIIGEEMPADFSAGIASAEEVLGRVRQYVEYFQMGYTLLIIFMLLMVLGIVLIIRNVRDVFRRLGIPLLTYGAMMYAGIWFGRYFIPGQLSDSGIPISLEVWMSQFIENMVKPLEIFSLGLLIGGAILTVISFVYKRGQSSV